MSNIVRHTVGALLEGKTPTQAAKLRIVDPACGSGSFLLGAYQYLLDWHRDWYVADGAAKHTDVIYEGAGGVWKLTTAERKRILLANLYGVDIDAQAVEVTKLSLLLRVLEGESEQSITRQLEMFKQRALPDLGDNIKCGNSLIGYDAPDGTTANPFDWPTEFKAITKAGGFDAVIGNPPYIRIQTLREFAPGDVEYYKTTYAAAAKGNYDIYVVFVERGLQLLSAKGRLGFILPHKFFNAQYGEPIRALLARDRALSHVVHFGDKQIFKGATTYTTLLFLEKGGNPQFRFVKVDDLTAWRATGQATEGTILAENVTGADWNFTVGSNADLFDRLSKMPVKLGNISKKIFQGLVTSCDAVYFLDPIEAPNDGYVKLRSKATGEIYDLETGVVMPLCKGSLDVHRYNTTPSKYVLFPYDAKASAETGSIVLIPTKRFAKDFPNAWKYLRENEDILRNREKGKMQHDSWYGYVYPKSVSLFATSKILRAHKSITSRD